MMKLSTDSTFDFELLRVLSSARDRGADIAEVLDAASRITPGDFESWSREFVALAEQVRVEGDRAGPVASSVTLRDRAFRAASYYRAADFFLHGQPDDPRIGAIYALATEQFDSAIARLPIPGERLTLQADGFTIPAILYRVTRGGRTRPTLLVCNGYDGSQEEMLHVCGFAALERGFNVLTFEGPGQPTVVRGQALGFRHDWERVVTPLVEYCQGVPEIDAGRLALFGYSFGGYLAPRAAAFEPRLRAVVCVDGVYDAFVAFSKGLPGELRRLFDAGQQNAFDATVREMVAHNTQFRWGTEQGMWAFQTRSPYDFLTQTRAYTLDGVADQIICPVLVCQAGDDHFFQGQPEQLAAALGERATFRAFTRREAAAAHCHVGASALMNGVVFDWLSETLERLVST